MKKILLAFVLTLTVATGLSFAEGFDTYKKNIMGKDLKIYKQIPKQKINNTESANNDQGNNSSGQINSYKISTTGTYSKTFFETQNYQRITHIVVTGEGANSKLTTAFKTALGNIWTYWGEDCKQQGIRLNRQNAYSVFENIRSNAVVNADGSYTTLVYATYSCFINQ